MEATGTTALPRLPHFDVAIAAPDLAPWRAGNTGIPGFTTRDSHQPGPHVALIALTHGNEIAGAIVLDRLLRAGLTLRHGRLTFGFANLAAFDRFDPAQPITSRFVDEDLNRVWDADTLDGPRRSCEVDRARQMRPLIDTVDTLLDLHSMLWPSDPLILSGPTTKGRALAGRIGIPPLIVTDPGHATGPRLIDEARFTSPDTTAAAILVEAGQHWEEITVQTTLACVAALLDDLGMVDPDPVLPLPPICPPAPRFAEVTQVVTATTASFAFTQPFRGGEIIRRRNTLIAMDGSTEIRTPHDNCLLVMPSLRPSRGHTAIRLARLTG
ncbi:MAG TPA: succinylglutamate desuccinylase/aspartoacylase family protein [Acetobacteraceae bacterium]|nr:succinylglutamate desuccinylase/aspartoacylase family protein [Acetobacteraceae bacterium]